MLSCTEVSKYYFYEMFTAALHVSSNLQIIFGHKYLKITILKLYYFFAYWSHKEEHSIIILINIMLSGCKWSPSSWASLWPTWRRQLCPSSRKTRPSWKTSSLDNYKAIRVVPYCIYEYIHFVDRNFLVTTRETCIQNEERSFFSLWWWKALLFFYNLFTFFFFQKRMEADLEFKRNYKLAGIERRKEQREEEIAKVKLEFFDYFKVSLIFFWQKFF